MSHSQPSSQGTNRTVVLATAMVVAAYAITCSIGLPQRGTQLILASHHHHEDQHHDENPEQSPQTGGDEEPPEIAEGSADKQSESGEKQQALSPPAFIWVAPFAILLLCIAVLPLLPQTEHWWENNLHRFYVALALGLVTLGYYLLIHHDTVECHWPAHGYCEVDADETLQWNLAGNVFANAILHEYVPFIVLLFSLYVISGGIRIEGNLPAHPLTNSAFIGIGGLLASFIGTTGAAMLLIRPLLETNRERRHKVHTVVFFIFVVCNCGGLLLPIGDPPLFLGYLRGVDFLWTLSLWKPWLFVNIMLLIVYWAWDHFFLYPHEAIRDITRDETVTRRLIISGWLVNVPLLIGVVLSVALLDPSKPLPGTHWHAPIYLREIVQLSLVAMSLFLGDATVRQKNHFNYGAIAEVAALFFGIFICMQPALQILNVSGPRMGVDTPMKFFWITGGLSSVLDNAPTYVVFFETARTLNPPGTIFPRTIVSEHFLIAISLGAVFMGAMTYIGNGPNFMVKAIAETSGIRMPSFFGYLKYSCAILLPILVVTTLLFF